MSRIEAFMEVHCPLKSVYSQWKQFETFPGLAAGIGPARQAERGDGEGKMMKVEYVPGRKIVWQPAQGAQKCGRVAFEPVGKDYTRVTLELDYEHEGSVEEVEKFLAMIARCVEGDLRSFRDFVESHRTRTPQSRRTGVRSTLSLDAVH